MEKTTRLKRDLAYSGTILKIYRDTVVANGIEEVYDYIHHDGAAAVLPVTKDGKILMVRQYRNALDLFVVLCIQTVEVNFFARYEGLN